MTGPIERPVGLRVTRVECDTCHQVQDFTHPTGPDAHLALNAVMGGQEWKKDGTAHTCRDCGDAGDPLPAPGSAHAYVAVQRTFSSHADRPEWGRDAIVIPEWDHKELEYWRRDRKGFALLPIGPDGDTGTRAIDPATAEQLADERALTDDQSTALAKAIAERDAHHRELLELRAVHDQLLGRYAVAVADKRAAEQAAAALVQVVGSVHQTDGLSDAVDHPDQPSEVDPDDASSLPGLEKAADRVLKWMGEWGDGCVDTTNGEHLFVRDLFVLARHVQKGQTDGE